MSTTTSAVREKSIVMRAPQPDDTPPGGRPRVVAAAARSPGTGRLPTRNGDGSDTQLAVTVDWAARPPLRNGCGCDAAPFSARRPAAPACMDAVDSETRLQLGPARQCAQDT